MLFAHHLQRVTPDDLFGNVTNGTLSNSEETFLTGKLLLGFQRSSTLQAA